MVKKIGIILLLIVFISSSVYSDEIDTEEIIWKDNFIQASNSKEEPKINSRSAVVYDRKSKK